MNLDEIRELVRLMVDNELSELDITDGESKIRLKRSGGEVVSVPPQAWPQGSVVLPGNAAAAAPAAPASQPQAPAEERLIDVTSPMVGTFYAAASPDSEPFVAVGARIDLDTVVCVIEAMKVMNEIKAECAGQVAEVCATNAGPVEYGQVLFRVRP